jgi:putative transposase
MADEKRLITVSEAAKLEGVSERALRIKVNKGSIKASLKEKRSRGGQNGKQWLIDPASLSVPAQAKWAKRMHQAEETRMAELEKKASEEQLTLPLVSERQGTFLPDGALNPAAVEEVCGKEVFEKAMQEARDKLAIVEKAQAIIQSRERITERVRALAAAHGVNPATLYRWLKDAEKGVAGLLRRRAAVVNGRRSHSITGDMAAVIRHAWCQPGAPKASAAIRKVEAFCRENGLPLPGRSSVRRFIANLDRSEKAMCDFARYGYEYWMKRHAPHGVRAEPERVMQIIEGDHHKGDNFVAYNGRPLRPWITLWFDVKSRCPVGWTISDQANGQTIALALANIMTKKKKTLRDALTGEPIEETIGLGGMPETLYVDNGEDYKSRLKKPKKDKKSFEMDQKSMDICRHLGIKLVFATPYHPQAKAHIERFFGTFAGQFSTMQPGWCGSSPETRPAGFDEKKLCEQGKLLTLPEYAERVSAWILNEYLNIVHSSLGCTPWEAHQADPHSDKKSWPTPYTLNMLRCLKDKARVYKEGIRRFGRLYWHEALDKHIGTDVVVRYDPAHLGEIYVSTKRDGWICVATNAELMRWDACQEDIRKMQHRRREMKKSIRERLGLDREKALSVEAAAKERRAAGERRIDAPTATDGAGQLTAITALDHIGRQAEKAKAKPAPAPPPPTAPATSIDPIERMILAKYDNLS